MTQSQKPQRQNIDRGEIVLAARSWIGTPYNHQHSAKGIFVDCVGLILGVGEETDALQIPAEDWAPYAAYSRTPNPRRMRRAMNQFLVSRPFEAGEIPPDGSIVWLKWRESLPMHLGICSTFMERRTVIHAYGDVGACVEHGFVDPWPSRIDSAWDYPGVR